MHTRTFSLDPFLEKEFVLEVGQEFSSKVLCPGRRHREMETHLVAVQYFYPCSTQALGAGT